MSGTAKVLLISFAVVAVLLGAGFVGWKLAVSHEAEKREKIEAQLSDCNEEQQQVIRDGQEAAGWVALADKQIGELTQEKKQLEKQYEDSIRVIRAMLPVQAEREIARYYRNRQHE